MGFDETETVPSGVLSWLLFRDTERENMLRSALGYNVQNNNKKSRKIHARSITIPSTRETGKPGNGDTQ